ncbi:Stx8 [Columba guinea]|nr:Stx8 [Columba guinea]
MAPDPWLPLHAAACQLAQEVAERIQERNRCQRNGESPAKLNVVLRSSLQNLREKIDQLKDLLLRAVSTHQIITSTQLEGDRRQNLVDDLLTRHKQLQASYKNEGPEPDVIRARQRFREDLAEVRTVLTAKLVFIRNSKEQIFQYKKEKSSLMTGGAKRDVTNPWLLEESEETRGLGFDDLRQQQRRIIEEQDAGLDALSSIISRQKQMGQEIGNELDEQNGTRQERLNVVLVTGCISELATLRLRLLEDEYIFGRLHVAAERCEIIDDLTNLVENTDDKLRNQTRHVKMVEKKSTSCGMLVVIVLLLIAIAVVAVWPTH